METNGVRKTQGLEPNEQSYILAGGALPPSFAPKDDTSLPQAIPPPLNVPVEQVDSVEDYKKEKSDILYTSTNYVNAIVGSGVIGMPFALHEAGFGVGLALLALVVFVADRSLILLIKAGRLAEVFSYQELAEVSFGRPGYYLCSILQFLYPFIALISYNIIVGDTITKVIIRVTGIAATSIFAKREVIVLLTTVIITLPLSLYRNITHLSKISLASVVLIVVIALSMTYRVPTMSRLADSMTSPWDFANPNLASAIGIMSFAFMCHHCCFMIHESLANNTIERWKRTTHISLVTAGVLTGMFAIAGYVPFTDMVQGDILENYCWRDDLMNACRVLYAFTILLTFPIELFVARDVIESTFFRSNGDSSFIRHTIITVVLSIAVMVLSFATDCLGVVLELNGILVAIPLAYILPGMCYVKVLPGPVFDPEKLQAWGVVMFGVISMFVGCVTFVMNIVRVADCSHGQEMDYCFVQGDNDTRTEVLF